MFIKEFEGVSHLLKPGVIEAELKASNVEIVGILVDANDDADRRFGQIRQRCLSLFPDIAVRLPAEGLIHTHRDGLKLGIWLMPNNVSCGMLEAFLLDFIPERDSLLRYANKAVKTALRLGAPFKAAHQQKAIVHTWLAWQDEPGAQLHQAVKKQVLDSTGPHAAPFVKWFRELFEV